MKIQSIKQKITEKINSTSMIFLTLFICFAYISIELFIGTGVYTDAGFGFLHFHNSITINGITTLLIPDEFNIAKDKLIPSVTWTPGQWLIPRIIMSNLNCKIGSAIVITTIIFSCIGLFGWYRLYKSFNINETIIGLSLLTIVCQKFFNLSFSIYTGGEVILFGIFPWIFIVFEKVRPLIRNMPILILVLLVGFVSKGNFVIISTLLVSYKIIELIIAQKKITTTTSFMAVYYGFVFILFFAIAYFGFISRGWNATSQGAEYSNNIIFLFFPVASFVYSAFCLDDILNAFFSFPGYNFSISTISLKIEWVYFTFFFTSISTLLFIYKKYKDELKINVIIFTCFFLLVGFHTYLYYINAALLYQMRYFRMGSLIMLPFLLETLFTIKNKFFMFTFSLWTISIAFGLYGFIKRTIYNRDNCPKSQITAIRYPLLSSKVLAFLNAVNIKEDASKNLFYLTDPTLKLEIPNCRAISTIADFQESNQLKNIKYHGHVRNLYILIPFHFRTNGKEDIIKQSFMNYSRFNELFIDDNYILLEGIVSGL